MSAHGQNYRLKARRLGTTRSALGQHLRELVRAGVYRPQRSPSHYRGSVSRVDREFWPNVSAGPAGTAEGACARTPPSAGPLPGPGPREFPRGRRRSLGTPQDRGPTANSREGLHISRPGVTPCCDRPAYRRSSAPKTRRRQGNGAGQACRWRRSSGRFCWAACASRSPWPTASQASPYSLRNFETSLQEVLDGDWLAGFWKHVRARLRRCEANRTDEARRHPRRASCSTVRGRPLTGGRQRREAAALLDIGSNSVLGQIWDRQLGLTGQGPLEVRTG